MFKVFATDVIVSKGYANQSAVRFSEDGKIVRFRIGKKVYDKNAENNTRWFNVSVKGFGPIAERIQKMQLKEGSLIHISGTLDEESWLDQPSNTTKTQTVIIIDDIDYASGSGVKKDGQNQQQNSSSAPASGASNAPENSPNFEGYSNFGGASFFDGNPIF
jgi:single-stranded DNA-binding protein